MDRDLPGEEVLVGRARSGDADAYAEIVQNYQDQAFRLAWILTRDADEAADAAQQGFINAFYALPRFGAGRPLRPWLMRIVANAARDLVRTSRARARLWERLEVSSAEPGPEDAAIAGVVRTDLFDALKRASRDDQLVLAYRFFLGLTEREMADALGCRPGTVKSRLSRALERLRRDFEQASLSDVAP